MKTAQPQGGMFVYVKNRGRAWVQSINSLTRTALVRFDCNDGMRSRVHKFSFDQIDFTREWKF
jgi:hypothetical protein